MPVQVPPLTITVGPDSGDFTGATDRALQAGVDYLAAHGGGTLRVLPGTYRMRNALVLRDNICVQGSGEDTILHKEPSTRVKLTRDSDWFDAYFIPEDHSPYQVGDGVMLMARHRFEGGCDYHVYRTIIGRDGDKFLIDQQCNENIWTDHDATVVSTHSLIHAEHKHDMMIRDIVLDGNREHVENLNGNWGAGIFMQNCHDVHMENVTVRNFNGDGYSWQIVHDVAVINCKSINNANLGLHPGSGSQRPVMRGNHIENCSLGLFFCWGVVNGIAENNRIINCQTAGISIGHRDTDNIIRNNHISGCKQTGILFREERTPDRCGHRNLVEKNLIEDCGPDEEPVGIAVTSWTSDLKFFENDIRESRDAGNAVGLRIGKDAGEMDIRNNRFTGFATEIEDLRREPAEVKG